MNNLKLSLNYDNLKNELTEDTISILNLNQKFNKILYLQIVLKQQKIQLIKANYNVRKKQIYKS